MKNFGKIIKENIINRFEGLLEFMPCGWGGNQSSSFS